MARDPFYCTRKRKEKENRKTTMGRIAFHRVPVAGLLALAAPYPLAAKGPPSWRGPPPTAAMSPAAVFHPYPLHLGS